jgi:hypothetical protein
LNVQIQPLDIGRTEGKKEMWTVKIPDHGIELPAHRRPKGPHSHQIGALSRNSSCQFTLLAILN